ncbi:MAG TPA: large conductance mechanosensitive channel protein MscL [Phycisphaerales bacterium]|nr:large conductance mechanosensitive channel protein MscL [Phycisphaerales bacterium]
MGFVKEFREFALKGNVMDMAVGIIIGGAFGVIVKSLIDDVVMPIVGIAGKADFSNMYVPLTPSTAEKINAAEALVVPPVDVLPLADARALGPVLAYGNFITVLINFLILAFAIFLMVKMMNTAKRRFEREQAAAPTPEPGPAADVVLLTEIRDILRSRP